MTNSRIGPIGNKPDGCANVVSQTVVSLDYLPKTKTTVTRRPTEPYHCIMDFLEIQGFVKMW